MGMTEDLLLSRWFLFLLIFARISGVLMPLPMFGAGRAPQKVRFAAAAVLSLFAFSVLLTLPVEMPGNFFGAAEQIGMEFLTGWGAGIGTALFFSVLAMLGELISRLGGFSAAASFDPAFGESVPALIPFLTTLGTVVFFTAGGFDTLIGSMLDSLTAYPAGQTLDLEGVNRILIQVLTDACRLALRMAFPFMLASFTCWLTAGLLGRAALSAGGMTLGFSANTLLTLAILHLSLAGICYLFRDNLSTAFSIFKYLGSGADSGFFSAGIVGGIAGR